MYFSLLSCQLSVVGEMSDIKSEKCGDAGDKSYIVLSQSVPYKITEIAALQTWMLD